MSEEELCLGAMELRQLNNRRHAMKVDEDAVFKISIVTNNRRREVAVYPTNLRTTVVWETHSQIHSGIERMINQLRLNWY